MGKQQDIINNIQYDELINLCENSKSKSEIFRKLKISDNSKNWNCFKEKLNNFNIELDKLWNKSPKYCLQCGKELTSKQNKFCSYSCATTYNNTHRDKSVYDKIGNTLRNRYGNNSISKKKEVKSKNTKIKKYYCKYCGKELTSNKQFCDDSCSAAYRKVLYFNYYIEHQDEFCRSNFVPRYYIREKILEKQNYTCSICGCNMIHNNKPLVFVLDHIDGDTANNHFENLRMVCPNCDSQLPTFKSKNKKSSRRDYFREHIKETVIQQIKDGSLII